MALALLLTLPGLAQSDAKKRGVQAREAGDFPSSIDLLGKVLNAAPGDAEAWWYQGLNYYDLDRYAECEAAFSRLVQLDKTNGGGWAFLGLCEFNTGKHKAALAHIIEAKRQGLQPGTALDRVAQYHYIQLLNKLGYYEAAAGPLADLARTQPDAPLLTEISGINALRLGLLPSEITPALEERVRLAGKATLFAWQRNASEAARFGEELLQKYPKQANAYYLMGWLRLLQHEEDSVVYFQKEIELTPGHVQARLQIAYELLQRGEGPKAMKYSAEAVKLAPGDFAAHQIHGRVLLDQGRPEQAIAELQRAVKLSPNSPEAHFALANAYQRAGRKTDADRHRAIFTKLEKERSKEPIPGVVVNR